MKCCSAPNMGRQGDGGRLEEDVSLVAAVTREGDHFCSVNRNDIRQKTVAQMKSKNGS